MAGPDGSIMYLCGRGGARGIHPYLADPLQMLRSEKRDIFGTFLTFASRPFNAMVE